MLSEQMNRGPGPAPRVKRTKVGDTVKLFDENEPKKKNEITWKVVAVHKWFVEIENSHGTRRGLTFGDLRIMGKE